MRGAALLLGTCALVGRATADALAGRRLEPDCAWYAEDEGCDWTADWSCPGQSAGRQGQAEDDGSIGFACCCEHGGWEQGSDASGNGTEDASPLPVPVAASSSQTPTTAALSEVTNTTGAPEAAVDKGSSAERSAEPKRKAPRATTSSPPQEEAARAAVIKAMDDLEAVIHRCYETDTMGFIEGCEDDFGDAYDAAISAHHRAAEFSSLAESMQDLTSKEAAMLEASEAVAEAADKSGENSFEFHNALKEFHGVYYIWLAADEAYRHQEAMGWTDGETATIVGTTSAEESPPANEEEAARAAVIKALDDLEAVCHRCYDEDTMSISDGCWADWNQAYEEAISAQKWAGEFSSMAESIQDLTSKEEAMQEAMKVLEEAADSKDWDAYHSALKEFHGVYYIWLAADQAYQHKAMSTTDGGATPTAGATSTEGSTSAGGAAGCCFSIGYGAMMAPCCLKTEGNVEESDCLGADAQETLGGAAGFSEGACPASADEAAEMLAQGKTTGAAFATTSWGAEQKEVSGDAGVAAQKAVDLYVEAVLAIEKAYEGRGNDKELMELHSAADSAFKAAVAAEKTRQKAEGDIAWELAADKTRDLEALWMELDNVWRASDSEADDDKMQSLETRASRANCEAAIAHQVAWELSVHEADAALLKEVVEKEKAMDEAWMELMAREHASMKANETSADDALAEYHAALDAYHKAVDDFSEAWDEADDLAMDAYSSAQGETTTPASATTSGGAEQKDSQTLASTGAPGEAESPDEDLETLVTDALEGKSRVFGARAAAVGSRAGVALGLLASGSLLLALALGRRLIALGADRSGTHTALPRDDLEEPLDILGPR